MVEVALPCEILDAANRGQKGAPRAERHSPAIAQSACPWRSGVVLPSVWGPERTGLPAALARLLQVGRCRRWVESTGSSRA